MQARHHTPEVNTSSMADIAFLLLTFFLVTTIINNDRSLAVLLPPLNMDINPVAIHERNLFTIQINSDNNVLIEGEPRASLAGLREELKRFILNNGKDNTQSDNPKEAVISIKTDRGTSYQTYLLALDEAQAAYFDIYGSRVGISAKQFRELDLSNEENKLLDKKGREGIPMNISIAEPTHIDN